MTPKAQGIWIDWFNRHAQEMESLDFPSRHAGAWSKLRAHAARFALILSRLRLACDPCPPDHPQGTLPLVTASAVRGAIQLVDYFKGHLAQVGHRVSAGIGSADAQAVVEWIQRHGRGSFRESNVKSDLRRFRDHPADLAAAIDRLKALGAIRPRLEWSGPSRFGRKPSPGYEVHPDLRPSARAPGNTENTAIDPAPRPSWMPPEPWWAKGWESPS
jgi:hypothetical protein